MSDYIRKDETIKALRLYAEQKHYGGEVELANGILKAVCFIEKEENIPTLDETEIIRKAFERVLTRLEEASFPRNMGDFTELVVLKDRAIEILKEECGINE